jgi:hypothetical protein
MVVEAGDAALCEEFARQTIEHLFVFTKQRGEPTFRIECLTNHHVTLAVEMFQLLGRE